MPLSPRKNLERSETGGERSPRAELVAATRDQEPIVANLLELYIHDFSDLLPLAPGPDGRFGYPQLSLYWSDPARHPFLIRVDGRLAGMVLVTGRADGIGGEPLFDITEFFVLRGFRRQGIGIKIAHEVWSRFPGRWQVRVMEANRAACAFWQRAISAYPDAPASADPVETQGIAWLVFSFRSRAHPSP